MLTIEIGKGELRALIRLLSERSRYVSMTKAEREALDTLRDRLRLTTPAR